LALLALIGCGALVMVLLLRQGAGSEESSSAGLSPTNTVVVPEPTQAVAVVEDPVIEPEIDPGTLLLDRERAEDRLGDFLQKKQELDRNAVLEWGDEAYAKILAISKSADQAFLREEYAAAVNSYEDAIARTDALIERIPEAVTELLEAGEAALTKANGDLAKRKFQAVLDIDSAHKSASVGLVRAGTIERVESLLGSGVAYENSKQYALALTDFHEAAQLDPLHVEAVAAAARVSERIQESKFRQLMTDALLAIEGEALHEGESILAEAESLYPKSEELADARFRIAEARRLIQIRELIERAREAEATERWRDAYGKYQETLAIDPHIAEAIAGRERTENRVKLLGQMKYYLDHLDELNTEQTREHSVTILKEAKALIGEEPKWLGNVSKFEEAVIAATTPVPVEIASDGRTSVDVYRVGRFGTFESKKLSLLPGLYTVIGHRKGYKDVRMKLKVDAGSDLVRTSVFCRDRI